MEARKAVAAFPFAPQIKDHPEELKQYALDGLATMGMVDESSLHLEIMERVAIDGIVLPWAWAGKDLPDDWIIARAEAFVIPLEEDEDGGP